jgi:multiple sugar transport system substrate-binding protein
MSQTKKSFSQPIQMIIITMILGSLLLSACNQSSDKGSKRAESVTISFAASEFLETQYEAITEEFESHYPDIRIQYVPLKDGTQQLEHAIAATLADVVMISPPQGQDNYYYLDLEPVLAADQNFDEDAFWSNALDGCRAEGRLIGIPLSIQTLLVMYDGSAFDEIGLEHPAPGWGWDDFQAAAQALSKRSGGEVTRYGFVDYNHPTSLLAPMMDAVYRQNGNEYDPLKLANALDWYVSLAQNGYIPRDYSAEEAGEVRDYISTGEAAMWVDALSSLEQRRNDLGDSIAVAPFPEGGVNRNQQNTQAWATCGLISAGTAYPQEAITWLQFLAGQEIPNANSMSIPAKRSIADENGFWNKLDINTSSAVRYALEHSWYGTASSLPFDQIGKAINDAKNGSVMLVDALATIEVDHMVSILPTSQKQHLLPQHTRRINKLSNIFSILLMIRRLKCFSP